MKKSAMLLAGLLLVSSMASAKVVGSQSGEFSIDSKQETLTFTVNAKVRAPLAAWWKDNGFFGSRTLVENMGDLSIGQKLPPIPTKEIYVIAPKNRLNKIHAAISVSPQMELARVGGGIAVNIPMELKDKNGGACGQSIVIDADSAGYDYLAVEEAENATSLTKLSDYVAGEVIEVRTNTKNIRVPLEPGNYTASAKIIVSLLP